MANGKNGNGFDELDDFWELDALLPPKATPPRRPADVETVEVSLGEKSPAVKNKKGITVELYGATVSERPQGYGIRQREYQPVNASGGAVKIDFDTWLRRRKDGDGRKALGSGDDETIVYVPKNPLIFSVRVIRRIDFDGIEERSLNEMRRLSDATAIFTENAEFTALFPQYSRMTETQKQCYIGFRTEVLNGRYPSVSEAYVLFLLYELINLPDRYPPAKAVKIFCALMREYRDCDDSLFSFMCDWLADFCLINKLDAPLELLEPIRERVYKLATWKEFFVPFSPDTSEPDACVLLSSASDYDYRTGKFYTAETAEYFEKHIPSALGSVIRNVSPDDLALNGTKKDVTTLTHNAFRNAFKSAGCRYTVSIDCACFTRSPLLRQTVTSVVKYAENFVREMLGIKSRLSISCLGAEKRKIVNAYFEPFIKRADDRPPLKRGRKKKLPEAPPVPVTPEYEKYYEPVNVGFSPELAARIENESWKTTDILLTAFEGDADEAPPVIKDENDGVNITTTPKDTVNLPKTPDHEPPKPLKAATVSPATQAAPKNTELQALRLLLRGKSRDFANFAREKGLLPDTLAERINQLALDTYGDIAIENDGSSDGFIILEDYRPELEEIAQKE